MAVTINQARSTISKMFNGEPRSYTRFNLAQNTDGDGSQVEVKLSTDIDDEVNGAEGGHRRAPDTYAQRPLRKYKNVCYLALGTLLVFVIGYLIGYVSHHKPEVELPGCPSEEGQGLGSQDKDISDDDGAPPQAAPHQPTLAWGDLTTLLGQKLSAGAFENTFSDFSMQEHAAGSEGDEVLASKVLTIFQDLNMSPWIDEHHVQLQVPSSDKPNKVLIGSEEVGSPKGYLAYSATGHKQGKVVYVNYGLPDDFKYLMDMKVDLNASVVLLRAGKISFAEKVANAAEHGAAAVLIYPDPADYSFRTNIELYGHVHLGTGDPYTPGFPSFNHTQFPPATSSGLPAILAQTITAEMALKIFQKMGGDDAPSTFQGSLPQLSTYKLGSEDNLVTVEVNNVLVDTKIHNVFGVIKGFVDADRYVVIGAQRDSVSWGYAKSTVGTGLLVELARAISAMVKNDGFRPRRSLVFASWSAGDYGSVGATEWLEGYLAVLDRKAYTYISLDGAVTGHGRFKASASPMLYDLLQRTLITVKSPGEGDKTVLDAAGSDWEAEVMEPMKMEDSAYPFLVFSGIPSISFRFLSSGKASQDCEDYEYYGTALDTKDSLGVKTSQKVGEVAVSAAQVAGLMALRLVHDHVLQLDVAKYTSVIRSYVVKINQRVLTLKSAGTVTEPHSGSLNTQWLIKAWGSYRRAAASLVLDIQNSDFEDQEMCHKINDRIMRVEHNLLSPYVSPKEVPFRHIIFGVGDHTMKALLDHVKALRVQAPDSDMVLFRNQFALATWTIQGCANALAGNMWVAVNQI